VSMNGCYLGSNVNYIGSAGGLYRRFSIGLDEESAGRADLGIYIARRMIAHVRCRHSCLSFIPVSKLHRLGRFKLNRCYSTEVALVRRRKSGSFPACYLQQQTALHLRNILNKGINDTWNSTCPASEIGIHSGTLLATANCTSSWEYLE